MTKQKSKAIKAATNKGLSRLQILQMQEIARQASEKATKEAAKEAFMLMLAIPVCLLAEDYWEKSAKKRVPKFINDCLSLYDSYEKGHVTIEELHDYLWEYGGVRIEDLQKACNRD